MVDQSGNGWLIVVHIPSSTNPLLDDGSGDCAVGQNGPVWSLAGSRVGPVERTYTVHPSCFRMSVGLHTLHFRAGDGTSDRQDVTYRLTIN